MALDDVRHVEAVAIMHALLDGDPDGPVAARVWCSENHPPPSAYMAAMTHLAGRGRVNEPCTCGHAPEEHVQSAGLGACEHEDCECIQYEADEEWDADD